MTPEQRIAERRAFRVALFRRRGIEPKRAEELADRLAVRDADRDDRRICLECSGLQRGGTCFPSRSGRIHGLAPPGRAPKFPLIPVPDILQRCEAFSFLKP